MAMLKEFRSVEFFQKGAVWNAGLLNTWAQNGKPAKPGLINLPLNSKLKHRTIYAYLWAKASVDPAANFCYVFCFP